MPQLYRVRTVHTGVAGAPYYTNLHFLSDGGTVQDCVDAVLLMWQQTVLFRRLPLISTVEGSVAIIQSETGEVIGEAVATGGPSNGTGTGEFLPFATQGLVRLRTATFVGGRRLAGRVFLPAVTQTHSENGLPTTPYRDAYRNAFTALINDPDTQLVVYSRTKLVAAVVANADVWSNFSVLRSRRD